MIERINTEIQLFYDTEQKKYFAKAWVPTTEGFKKEKEIMLIQK